MKNGYIAGAVALPLLITGVILGVYYSQPQTPTDKNIPSLGRRPNIIVFLTDDTGYADFHGFGHPTQEWNAIDRMASEGTTFTQWTAGDRVCSPSRAAFMTSRYPVRTGVYGQNTVFQPDGTGGLPYDETTIAESLRDLGYATGMVGKWHLGINEKNSSDGVHLPVHHGFDYVGRNLPLSQHWLCDMNNDPDEMKGDCFLYNGNTIIEQPINVTTLSRRLLADSKTFLNDNSARPFFFFYSFPQTHMAMFCDAQFCGKSQRGSFGDNVNEMAWAVGEVLDELDTLGISQDTLTILVSDNGAFDLNCPGDGTNGMFRGGKGNTWEGGLRVPAIVRWPGTIAAGVTSSTLINTMDILPTALYLAGNPTYLDDKGIVYDGQVIPDIVPEVKTPRTSLFYYCSDRLMAVRYNQYKIHYYTIGTSNTRITYPETDPACNGNPDPAIADCYGSDVFSWDPPLVFNVMSDPSETLIVDTSTQEMQNILTDAANLVKKHQQTIVYVPSEIDKIGNQDVVPCCDPPACICNFNP